jgi:hypothetical protein
LAEAAVTGLPPGDLETALLDAHAAGDGSRLAVLYGQAADAFSAAGDVGAACFCWTQALVFALEAGSADAGHYAGELRRRGRL